ncbi:GNAT family N-acetyltransferase [Aneurinibacillus sp. REN35]|uniref:GNAT family N-acetyltransferase n=1 Tax=Aneurinibacillus sp. REN35 TaxID=3237286 RepID=UPI003528473B
MTPIQPQPAARQGLTEQEKQDIRQLAAQCKEHESIEIKLIWDMLDRRSNEETNDFLYYENGTLLGYLALYQFNQREIEIVGMTHPKHRQRGIFKVLSKEAMVEGRRRGVHRLLFVCPRQSIEAKHFATSIHSTYSFSEYHMKLIEHTPYISNPAVYLKRADMTDIDILTALNQSGFAMIEQEARGYTIQALESPNTQTYIAYLKKDDFPIGRISVMINPDDAFIYGFCVDPAFRGQGHGRHILALTLDEIQKQQLPHIALEVACENENALHLYQSCGFEKAFVHDYYECLL